MHLCRIAILASHSAVRECASGEKRVSLASKDCYISLPKINVVLMELYKAILTRRSIRKYTDESVENKLVEQIIRAGMMAPSAGNEQPWHFLVIRQRATLEAISRDHLYASMVHLAQLAILVCGDLTLEKYAGYWMQDCAAATQNMLLTAHDLGLGGVWIGLHPREQRVGDIRRVIALPEHIVPFCLVPLGYPNEDKPDENRFDRSRIHFEQW